MVVSVLPMVKLILNQNGVQKAFVVIFYDGFKDKIRDMIFSIVSGTFYST